jgi:hypothetical protein
VERAREALEVDGGLEQRIEGRGDEQVELGYGARRRNASEGSKVASLSRPRNRT